MTDTHDHGQSHGAATVLPRWSHSPRNGENAHPTDRIARRPAEGGFQKGDREQVKGNNARVEPDRSPYETVRKLLDKTIASLNHKDKAKRIEAARGSALVAAYRMKVEFVDRCRVRLGGGCRRESRRWDAAWRKRVRFRRSTLRFVREGIADGARRDWAAYRLAAALGCRLELAPSLAERRVDRECRGTRATGPPVSGPLSREARADQPHRAGLAGAAPR